MCSLRERSGFVLIATVILFLAGGPARADLLFSTFGPGDTYSTIAGVGIGNFGVDQRWGSQFSFPGPQAYRLTTIELAAALFTGDNQLNVSVMTDAAGQPGSVLESFSFTGQMKDVGINPSLLTGTSLLHPVLTGGTDYWLVAAAPSNTEAVWYDSLSSTGLHALSLNGGAWSVGSEKLGAFRISGEPVPLPGAVLLGVLGLSSAGWCLRRRIA